MQVGSSRKSDMILLGLREKAARDMYKRDKNKNANSKKEKEKSVTLID